MVPNFYNCNRNRAYPFEAGTVAVWNASAGTVEALADEVLVDAGFVVGLESGFQSGVHSIWLSKIIKSGAELAFQFTSDAPGLYEKPLVFTCNTADAVYTTVYADNSAEAYGTSDDSDTSEPGICPNEPLWYGFIVIGKLSSITASVLSRTTGGVIEPTLCKTCPALMCPAST